MVDQCQFYPNCQNTWRYNGLKPDQARCLVVHSDSVNSVGFSKDGKFLASGSRDKTIKFWNLEEKREEFSLAGHSDWVTSVAFSKDGKFLAIGSYDKNINIWTLR